MTVSTISPFVRVAMKKCMVQSRELHGFRQEWPIGAGEGDLEVETATKMMWPGNQRFVSCHWSFFIGQEEKRTTTGI
jgi:hypothetical protein